MSFQSVIDTESLEDLQIRLNNILSPKPPRSTREAQHASKLIYQERAGLVRLEIQERQRTPRIEALSLAPTTEPIQAPPPMVQSPREISEILETNNIPSALLVGGLFLAALVLII